MTEPATPRAETPRVPPRQRWVVLGAIIGGILVAPYHLSPGWLWGGGAGVFGALTAVAAGWVWDRPWPTALRLLIGLLVLVVGFGVIWLAAAREWVLNPAGITPP